VNHFCTYFDRAYLPQGLALHAYLQRHTQPFRLWILCLDQTTYDVVSRLRLPNVEVIAGNELELVDPDLLRTKSSRTTVEYYFTSTPSWIQFVIDRCPKGEIVTYLDADLFFFSNPTPLFDELGDASVLIVGHRFATHDHEKERFGKYNVGLLSFRSDDAAMACLSRWREQCLEWCFDRIEPGRYADQKYLDDWPERYLPHVRVLEHKGGGLAPWNLQNYNLMVDEGAVFVDGDPLVFFHFHGLKPLNRWVYDAGAAAAGPSRIARKYIYGPYLTALHESGSVLRRHAPDLRLSYQDQRYGWSFLQRCTEGAVQRRLLLRSGEGQLMVNG
jgi:hypothetical protein